MKKKGLSSVLTTVLIILLVLALIVLIWLMISRQIESGSSKLETGFYTSSFSIPRDKVFLDKEPSKNKLNFILKRNAGEARIKGVVIILKGSNKQEKDFRDYENVSIGELETLKIHLNYTNSEIESVEKIEVYSIIKNEKGVELTSRFPVASYKFEEIENEEKDIPPVPECTAGNQRQCNLTLGVCQDRNETCRLDETWPGCFAVDYGFDYQSGGESFCTDSFDNDCDGSIDCDDSDCSSNPRCQPIPGLILHYFLNKDVIDSSGNGNHGSIVGLINFANSGIENNSAEFNKNQYINAGTLGNFGSLVGNSSVSFWINTTDKTSLSRVIGIINPVISGLTTVLTIQTNSRLKSSNSNCDTNYFIPGSTAFYMSDLDVATNHYNRFARYITTDLYDGGWHHVVWNIVDSKTKNMEIYVDGVPQTLNIGPTICNQLATNFHDWKIGLFIGAGNNRGAGVDGKFKGQLDEIMIFNRSLSNTEIQALYNSY